MSLEDVVVVVVEWPERPEWPEGCCFVEFWLFFPLGDVADGRFNAPFSLSFSVCWCWCVCGASPAEQQEQEQVLLVVVGAPLPFSVAVDGHPNEKRRLKNARLLCVLWPGTTSRAEPGQKAEPLLFGLESERMLVVMEERERTCWWPAGSIDYYYTTLQHIVFFLSLSLSLFPSLFRLE